MMFDTEPEHYIPDEEELRFLKERDKLEEETAFSFELYLENYERLKEISNHLKINLYDSVVFEFEH